MGASSDGDECWIRSVGDRLARRSPSHIRVASAEHVLVQPVADISPRQSARRSVSTSRLPSLSARSHSPGRGFRAVWRGGSRDDAYRSRRQRWTSRRATTRTRHGSVGDSVLPYDYREGSRGRFTAARCSGSLVRVDRHRHDDDGSPAARSEAMRVADPSRRDRLVDAILRFLVDQDLLDASDIRVELEREIDAAGPDAVFDLKTRLETDHGWNYYPRDRLAHAIHHRLADRFLDQGSIACGVNHLTGLVGTPIVCAANHLSYADANVIEMLLHRAGAEQIANRLTAVAGPKVFTSRDRRFSSLCFGTIKVPQSAEVSSGEAALNAREVAVAARRSIDVALERLRSGDVLLLFAEGTRSRTGAMQAMLPGVARYLTVPRTWVVPVGLTGTEHLFSVNDSRLQPARVIVQIGDPVLADTLRVHARGDRAVMMNAIGLAIAELLPEAYRGAYGHPDQYVEAARVLRQSRGIAEV